MKPQDIARAVSAEFGVTQRAVLSPRPDGVGRPAEPLPVSTARLVLMYLLREARVPSSRIATFTQRDESSVRYATRVVKARIRSSEEMRDRVKRIQAALTNGAT